MSKFRFGIVVLALLTLATTAMPAPRHNKGLAIAPGESAPALRGTTADGERILVDYPSRDLTLINFWALYCEPCKEEMPALQKLMDEHDNLQVIGVVMEEVQTEDLAAFLETLGVTYPNVVPWGRAWEEWGEVRIVPTSFLIDKKGKIVRRYVGSTPKQLVGLVHDIGSYLAGDGLGPYVFPED